MSYTSKQVRDLTGIPKSTQREWLRKGVVKPITTGRLGRGNSTRYAEGTVLGMALANALRSREGACLSYVRDVIDFVESFTEEGLLEEFDQGNCFLLPVSRKHMTLTPMPQFEGTEHRDLRRYYRRIKRAK